MKDKKLVIGDILIIESCENMELAQLEFLRKKVNRIIRKKKIYKHAQEDKENVKT